MHRFRTDLERQLLRKGVGALASARHACTDCGRTPLPGETVHRYGGALGDPGELVCTLCRPRRVGEPQRSERVQHPAHGATVRPAARAA